MSFDIPLATESLLYDAFIPLVGVNQQSMIQLVNQMVHLFFDWRWRICSMRKSNFYKREFIVLAQVVESVSILVCVANEWTQKKQINVSISVQH